MSVTDSLRFDRIYTLEKQNNQKPPPGHQNIESSLLLPETGEEPDHVFTRALDHELERICAFYQLKELELYGELDSLLKEVESYEAEVENEQLEGLQRSGISSKAGRSRQNSLLQSFGMGRKRRTSLLGRSLIGQLDEDGDSDEEEADERSALRKPGSSIAGWDSHRHDDMRNAPESPNSRRRASQIHDDYMEQSISALYDSGVSLKKRIISLYVSLCELRSFVQLNKTGFAKVLKKYDKIMNRGLKQSYLDQNVYRAPPFKQETTDHLNENISKVEQAYAKVATNGDTAGATRELRLHLREHVVWERNTVWREMIGIERKAQAANMGIIHMLGKDTHPRKQGDETLSDLKVIRTPVGRFHCPVWILNPVSYILLASIVVFILLLHIPFMEIPEQQNCLALVVFVSLLWATEVRPFFLAPEVQLTSPRQFRCLSRH